FSAARPGCKVIFVSTTAPVSRAPGKERPKSLTAQGIASWIESLGGRATLVEGNITVISLARVPFTDAQLAYLKPLRALERLNLEATDISDLGLSALRGLASLRDLNLNFNSISDRGLASLGPLTGLERLSLAGTLVKGAGMAQVAGLA